MAKGFVKSLNEMIENREKEIWINWINIPEYLCRKNPNIIKELREKLFEAGYKRKTDYNAPQEEYSL